MNECYWHNKCPNFQGGGSLARGRPSNTLCEVNFVNSKCNVFISLPLFWEIYEYILANNRW